jgi:SAM-dependent methyltransferase
MGIETIIKTAVDGGTLNRPWGRTKLTAELGARIEDRLPGRVGRYIRTGPVTSNWGYSRGTPIDRWYIERFLDAHRNDIRGRVLEIKSDDYIRRFGSAVEQVDILDYEETNERATIVADLEQADDVPDAIFDCFVLTQTLHLIFDVRAGLRQCWRILKPGGVLLVTVPANNKVDFHVTDYWRFTQTGLTRAVSEVFGPSSFEIGVHGNSCVTAGFLTGLAAEEFDTGELESHDERFPLVLTCRAVRAADGD